MVNFMRSKIGLNHAIGNVMWRISMYVSNITLRKPSSQAFLADCYPAVRCRVLWIGGGQRSRQA
ncbi:MAG: hypothetical protein GPOALKHO_001925 [Sodalis sp.]|nr:MAG: hypothetical protein GPOALKHO_001925 [Sodalis sp.]